MSSIWCATLCCHWHHVQSVRTTLSGCRDRAPNVMLAMSPASRLARPRCMSGTVVQVVCAASPLTPLVMAITLAVMGVSESIVGHRRNRNSSERVALSVAGMVRLHATPRCGGPTCGVECGCTSLAHTAPGTSLPSHVSTFYFFPALCVATKANLDAHTHECAHAQAPSLWRSDHAGDTQSNPFRAVPMPPVAYNALTDTHDS